MCRGLTFWGKANSKSAVARNALYVWYSRCALFSCSFFLPYKELSTAGWAGEGSAACSTPPHFRLCLSLLEMQSIHLGKRLVHTQQGVSLKHRAADTQDTKRRKAEPRQPSKRSCEDTCTCAHARAVIFLIILLGRGVLT